MPWSTRHLTAAVLALALSVGAARRAAGEEPALMLSVKLIKESPGRCAEPPALEFVGSAQGWRVTGKPLHAGEIGLGLAELGHGAAFKGQYFQVGGIGAQGGG